VQEGGREAAAFPGLPDDWVHFAVDSDAPVAGAFERLLGEPVVPVPALEDLYKAVPELLEFGLTDIASTQSYKVDQEI